MTQFLKISIYFLNFSLAWIAQSAWFLCNKNNRANVRRNHRANYYYLCITEDLWLGVHIAYHQFYNREQFLNSYFLFSSKGFMNWPFYSLSLLPDLSWNPRLSHSRLTTEQLRSLIASCGLFSIYFYW
jgi:hypothetical protein